MEILLWVVMGFLVVAAVRARNLRQDTAADRGSQLRHVELRLGTLNAELNLASKTPQAALNLGVLHA
jgi:hypothetical protein